MHLEHADVLDEPMARLARAIADQRRHYQEDLVGTFSDEGTSRRAATSGHEKGAVRYCGVGRARSDGRA
ncbi:MAG: hypothetical protein H0X37_18945 [Herpetosiphonaceae bacterium]|nr:hypothetical protein [Herpetosiphonaceae bacterium]